MTQSFKRAVCGVAPGLLAALVVSLAGCNGFFVKETTGGGSGTGSTGNYVYASNSTAGSTTINGYTLAKGTLTAATSSPYLIGITPTAMVVSRNSSFLYAASAATTASPLAGIYGFSIGTGGALTVLNGGFSFVQQTPIAAMDVSADGNWLVVASTNDGLDPVTITAYPLSTSGSVGMATASLTYAPGGAAIVSAVKVAPSGNFISIALGTPGFITFPFNSSTGAISVGTQQNFPSSTVGAYDIAIDSNNFLYVAATSNVYTFTVSTVGIPTTTAVSTVATAAGGPFSLALDGTSYLYASAVNNSSNLIYGFSIKSGVLTPLSTATIAGPPTTSKMGVDSTGAYLVAQGYDPSAGLKLYGIGSSTGVLTSLDTAPDGTTLTIPTALALTH
jgi:6-phosphogluconolactonase (cycloisomerase 2 family)